MCLKNAHVSIPFPTGGFGGMDRSNAKCLLLIHEQHIKNTHDKFSKIKKILPQFLLLYYSLPT